MTLSDRKKAKQLEFILAIVAIICIIAAGVIGYTKSEGSIEPSLKQAMPEATKFENVNSTTYAGYLPDGKLLGYVAIAAATGYGGPFVLATATNLKGDVVGVSVVDHKETPSWFEKVAENGFYERLLGKKYSDNFILNSDIDGVSGATYTAHAIAKATSRASQDIAKNQLGFSVPEAKPEAIVFGVKEAVLIALFIVAFIGHRREFQYTKQVRWLCMLTGLLVLGFMYTNPLTISQINQLLLGYFPSWRTHLYFYLLVGGVFLVIILDNKNPYCSWFCPFGAVQECMNTVGGAKASGDFALKTAVKWAHRGLVFTAIIVALIFRNPGISSYEVFGVFFDLNGAVLSFIILGLVLVASLFIRRPWCNFLCPIPPIEDFIRTIKRKVKRA